jgi:hypothetical protein
VFIWDGRARKIGLVLAGYGAALIVASVGLVIRLRAEQGPEAQASSGMYAFGDLLFFLAVFGTLSLIPTGLALWFLRSHRRFWNILSAGTLVFATTGVVAVALYTLANAKVLTGTRWYAWAGLSVLRMIPAPGFAAACTLGAVLAPTRSARWSLITATAVETGVGAYFWSHLLLSNLS